MRAARRVAMVVALVGVAFAAAPARQAQETAAGEQRSSAEKGALGYMRTVINAERMYRKKHAKYAASLAGLVGSGSFTRRLVKTDRGEYSVHFSGKADGYTVGMVPKTFDAEHRAFWANENGIVHYETEKAAGAQSPVLKN